MKRLSKIGLFILILAATLKLPCHAQPFGLGDDVEETAYVAFTETFGLDGADISAPGDIYVPPVQNSAKTLYIEKQPVRAVVVTPAPVVKKTVVERPLVKKTTTVSAPYVSPPGYHRHVMVDGTIIEHADYNYGDPVAHAGVAGSNWPKYYGPLAPTAVINTQSGRTVTRTRSVQVQQSSCPGGVCPMPQSARPRLLPWRR